MKTDGKHNPTPGCPGCKSKERMSALEETDELSTAVSYYLLYQNIKQSTVEEAFWKEDEWTEQDTLEAEQILKEAQERCNVPANQYSSPPCKDWNTFYENHRTNFFNDRHYLYKAFPEEFATPSTLVEIGCGVGNAILPLLKDAWTVWGLDFSPVAIDLLRNDERFRERQSHAHAHVWDISQAPPNSPLPWFGVANVSTLLFCLSALHPNDMVQAAHNVAATLQKGGTLCVRDYGRYDEAQLKLGTSRGKRLGEHFYRKQDGTRVYYFSLQDLDRLFVEVAGLEVLELGYIRRVYHNRATRERRRRVWVQGRFRKPI
jgi:SAM-dependent methyltransferase